MAKNNSSNSNQSIVVFPGISGIIDIHDNNRKELILIEIEGDKNAKLFDNLYIMNFDSSDKSDYMVNKDIANSFVFTSFGHSATTLVLSGFQSAGIDTADTKGNIQAKSKPTQDAESIYRNHCISGPNPKLITVTTGVKDIVNQGSIYRGYMVAFNKKPMGEEKLQGYAFNITMICKRKGEVSDQ